MDNIKDRQLYWEVKDFLNKTPEVSSSKSQSNIKNAINNVLNENKPFRQSSFVNNPKTIENTKEFIRSYNEVNKVNRPDCVAYTKNHTSNPFKLNEGFADSFQDAINIGVRTIGEIPGSIPGIESIKKGVHGIVKSIGQAEGFIKSDEEKEAEYQKDLEQMRTEREAKEKESADRNRQFRMGLERITNPEGTSAQSQTATPAQSQNTTQAGAPAQTASSFENTGAGRAIADYLRPSSAPKPTTAPTAPQRTPTPTSTTAPAGGAAPAPAPTTAPQRTPAPTAAPQRAPASTPTSVPARNVTQNSPSNLNSDTFKGVNDKITMNLPKPEMTIGMPTMRNRNTLSTVSQNSQGPRKTNMAPAPQRPERTSSTNQFADMMGMQRQQNLSQVAGQMGSMSQPTYSMNAVSSNTVVPFNQLMNRTPSTTKESQFKYSSGSRLA